MRPVSVMIVVGFFGRPPFPRIALLSNPQDSRRTGRSPRVELALFGGIISPSDSTELDLRLLARSLWRPDSVKSNCVAT